MATTGAVLYLRPTLLGVTGARRSTGAALVISLRMPSGVFTNASIQNSSENQLKAWLPPPRVKLVDDNGLMRPEWYRFFRYIAEDRLGGANGPSVPDVASSLGDVQSAVTTNVGAVNVVAAAVNTNAGVLQSTVEVTKQNSLAGSDQIGRPISVNGYRMDEP